MASNSPASSLPKRVCTLPRRLLTFRSGRAASAWHWRRKLDVPKRAPCGRSNKLLYWFETNASVGFSRSQMTLKPKPSGNSIGTSFILCTAMSARPSNMAASNSLTNNPLPPILANGVSRMMSPCVLNVTSSTSNPGWKRCSSAFTNSACHRASLLLRVAMRSGLLKLADDSADIKAPVRE